MAQEAVFTVLDRAATIAVDEARFLADVSDRVQSAKRQLRRMQCFLKDVDEKMLRGGAMAMARNLVSEVREVSYEVEDIIDTANILTRQSNPKVSIKGGISKYACFPVCLTHLHRLGTRIDSADAKMKTIFDDFEKYGFAFTAIAEEEAQGYITEDDTIRLWRSVRPGLDEQVDVIGFDDQIRQIKNDMLDRGKRDLTVVSIVGPGGAGKSTLASKSVAASTDFEVRAWITVSQRFGRHALLKDMVKSTNLKEMVKRTKGLQKAEEIDNMSDDELEMLLHESLLSRRYLIALDDVWSTDAWDIMRTIFPDGKNGSRVVLTTRNMAVAEHPNRMKKIYTPKLLDDKESTELLLSTALPAYNPVGSSNGTAMTQNLEEMKELGRDLAVKCAGLPLAIVILGGYLSRNLDVAEWRRLAVSVNWHDMISNERVLGAIMDLSYYDMPSRLRSCFMYTTAFPEDSRINVRVLARLWVAEGFIPLVRGHTREEIAIKYVNELVQRCMIQVEERASSSGRIMVIKVHDVLRDWGIGRARREGFMKDCQDAKDVKAAYSEEAVEAYRVVLHGFLAKEVGVSMRKLRTLLSFKFGKVEVTKSFQGLHHLRVLYLHSSEQEMHLPGEIGRMRYLRYLGFGGTCTYHLPSSTANLLSLEVMDATGGKIDRVPGSLFKIPALRHVHVSWTKDWSMPHLSSQSNLHVTVLGYKGFDWFQGLRFDPCNCIQVKKGDDDDDDEDEARRFKQRMEQTKRHVSQKKNPNLSCCFGMMYESRMGCQMDIVGRCKERLRFPNDHLDFPELETSWDLIVVLKICCANLLSDDQKMRELASMELLMILELGERSYAGATMTCFSNSFPRLQRLILYDLAVETWNMEHGSMRALRELVLCKCPNLRSLPEELSQLQRLGELDLIAMPPCCSQPGTVARELETKGCKVIVSSDEKDFRHLDVPCRVFYYPDD